MPQEYLPVNVKVLFFAKTRDLSGVSETNLEVLVPQEGIKAADLLCRICSTFNLSIIEQSVILAINEHYCDNLQEYLQLKEGDEVAVIPPISGG